MIENKPEIFKLEELFDKIVGQYGNKIKLASDYPYCKLFLFDKEIACNAADDSLERLSDKINVAIKSVMSIEKRYNLRIEFVEGPTDEKLTWYPEQLPFWLFIFIQDTLNKIFNQHRIHNLAAPEATNTSGYTVGAIPNRHVHFFGYKGGLGRTTLMANASVYASLVQGSDVLLVELDFEAPSLNSMLGVKNFPIHSSLCSQEAILSPFNLSNLGNCPNIRVLFSALTNTMELHELFAFNLSLQTDLKEIELLGEKIRKVSENCVVFFDHRTGHSQTLLPWLKMFPGVLCVFLGTDGQSEGFGPSLSLVSRQPFVTQTVVCHNLKKEPDSEPEFDEIFEICADFANDFVGNKDGETETQENVFLFPYQPEFDRNNSLYLTRLDTNPDFMWESDPYSKQIKNFCDALNLAKLNFPKTIVNLSLARTLTQDGNRDSGVFQFTSIYRKLANERELNFVIFGRKGNGKSRLQRELGALPDMYKALVDSSNTDVTNNNFCTIGVDNTFFKRLMSDFEKYQKLNQCSFERFWYTYLYLCLQSLSQKVQIEKLLEVRADAHSVAWLDAVDCLKAIKKLGDIGNAKPILLFDGLELLQPEMSHNFFSFIKSFLSVLRSIFDDRNYTALCGFRVFIRTDLLDVAVDSAKFKENSGLILSWNRVQILNFFLLRVSEFAPLRPYFDRAMTIINKGDFEHLKNELKEERLKEAECLSGIKAFFPQRYPAGNAAIDTFMLNYFTDRSGAKTSGTDGFIPRVYHFFVEKMAALVSEIDVAASPLQIPNEIILSAYASASERYFFDVKEELSIALQNQGTREVQDSKILIDRFCAFLNGRPTPFVRAELLSDLAETAEFKSDSDLPSKVLAAFEQLNIFEQVTTDNRKLRCGTLFKTALKMKFNRVRSGDAE